MLEDIKHCEKKPGAPISVEQASHISENFSSVIRHVICKIYLDGASVPTLDIILDKVLQKEVKDLERLNLFHGQEIPGLSSFCGFEVAQACIGL